MRNFILVLILLFFTTPSFAQTKAQAISAEQLRTSARFEKVFPPPPAATTVRISSITIDVLNSKVTVRYETGYVEGDGEFINVSYGEYTFINENVDKNFDTIMNSIPLDMDRLTLELSARI